MQNNDRYHELFERAEGFYEEGLLYNAERFAIDTIKDNPKFAPAFQLLMKICRKHGLEKEALLFQKFREPLYIPIPEKLKKIHFKNYVRTDCSNKNQIHSYSKIELVKEDRTKLSPVSTDTKKHSKYFDKLYLNSAPTELFQIPHGKIWEDGFNQIIWDKDGKLIPELCRGHAELIDYIVQTRKPESYQGNIAVVSNRIPDNYYHWFTDIIPAFNIMANCGYTNDEIDYYLLNPVELDYQKESLKTYNIPTSKHIVHNRQTYLEADQLIVSRWGSNSLGVHVGSWISEELKNTFLIKASDTPLLTKERIYISRGQTASRQIINEPQLTDLLSSKYDFSIVDTCDYSIAEQATLFSNAKYVVAAHGAALTNTHFCEKDTTVFEIFGDYVDPCFWILSNRLGFNHYFHQPDHHRLSNIPLNVGLGERRKSDIHVDVSAIDNEMRKILK